MGPTHYTCNGFWSLMPSRLGALLAVLGGAAKILIFGILCKYSQQGLKTVFKNSPALGYLLPALFGPLKADLSVSLYPQNLLVCSFLADSKNQVVRFSDASLEKSGSFGLLGVGTTYITCSSLHMVSGLNYCSQHKYFKDPNYSQDNQHM